MNSFIYGVFDRQKDLSAIMQGSTFSGTPGKTIFHSGYQELQDGDITLILFSRIYNQSELGKQFLISPGNDAELVLFLYRKEGTNGLKRLNGKFTAVFYEKDQVTIVRDRNGEGKMIYFTPDFFTDSYQGLAAFRSFKPEPDLTGITTFLKIGYIPAPNTAMKGVYKVPAGEILVMQKGNFHFK